MLVIVLTELMSQDSDNGVKKEGHLCSFMNRLARLPSFLALTYLQYILYRGVKEYRLMMYTRIQKQRFYCHLNDPLCQEKPSDFPVEKVILGLNLAAFLVAKLTKS